MIEITDRALHAIRDAIASAEAAAGLRIMVEPGGCAGNRYMMGIVLGAENGDHVVEQRGVTVFVDPNSAPLLSGTVVDFTEGMEGPGFTFANPNAKSTCSCGKSFC